MERVFVDERDEAYHQGHRPVAANDIRISTVLQKHVEQLIAKLPVSNVSQHAGQRRVPWLIDTGSSALTSNSSWQYCRDTIKAVWYKLDESNSAQCVACPIYSTAAAPRACDRRNLHPNRSRSRILLPQERSARWARAMACCQGSRLHWSALEGRDREEAWRSVVCLRLISCPKETGREERSFAASLFARWFALRKRPATRRSECHAKRPSFEN